MTILRYLDSERYVVVRKGVKFYYFGSGCIADYYSNSIAYLDESNIKIILLCDGKNTLQAVAEKAAFILSETQEAILARMDVLLKKGVIVLRSESFNVELCFSGTKGAYYPKEIVIELTNMCNFFCPFCYKNANSKGKFMSDSVFDELNKTIQSNVKNILLTGGEPTLHPNYLKYIDILTKYADVHMISNGSNLYNHDSSVLRKLRIIQFSIYGCSDAEYEKMTGVNGAFTRLCKSVEFVKRNGIDMNMAVTLCDETIDHVELFIKAAIEFDAGVLRIGFADVFGRGKYLYEQSSDFATKRDDEYSLILELKRKYRNKIFIEVPNINVKHVENHDDISTYIHRGSLECGCGSQYLVVSHVGEIRPCQMLSEVWFSVEDKTALKDHICGNFHIEKLRDSINKYYIDNLFSESKIEPCYALEAFRAREKT